MNGLILKDKKGVVLIVALLILLVLTLIGISAISTTTFETNLSGNQRVATNAFYAAEAGVQMSINQLRADTNTISIPRTPLEQGSSESYYQSTAVHLSTTGSQPGYSIEEGGSGGFKFRFYQVKGTGDSFGAVKQIEVQVGVPAPAE